MKAKVLICKCGVAPECAELVATMIYREGLGLKQICALEQIKVFHTTQNHTWT